MNRKPRLGVLLILATVISAAIAQESAKPAPPPSPSLFRATPNDTLISPIVAPDKRVTFSLYAPDARSVLITGEWMEFFQQLKGVELQRADNGVWSLTAGPVAPGIYRYSFIVDGVRMDDPRNPSSSQALSFVHSMVAVPGLDYQDVQDVPHGAVETVWYQSKSLGGLRRMHVYTPPGYDRDASKYPVFYLFHGASDSDDSWSTVGHAGFILDNLIAAGQAKPMIVVMPAGHTDPFFIWGQPLDTSAFEKDFEQDILPYVESHYRVLADRPHRAIAGLSMGGMNTLNISVPNLRQFAYIGVFSSGWFPPALEKSEKQFAANLDDADAKKGLKLVWFATGKEDFMMGTSKSTIDLLQRHGFTVEFHESGGGHTWENWRDYLHQFAPRLFQ